MLCLNDEGGISPPCSSLRPATASLFGQITDLIPDAIIINQKLHKSQPYRGRTLRLLVKTFPTFRCVLTQGGTISFDEG
jgi:hypothetical protein